MTAESNFQLAFRTAAECRQWLVNTPLGHNIQAQTHLLRQLDLLNKIVLSASERLAILEVLRKPILKAQTEGAGYFTGKALPLASSERTVFDSGQALWQLLFKAYRLCIRNKKASGVTAGDPQLALLFQRAFVVLVAAQTDNYRAGCEPEPEHWLALHKLYASAENAGVIDIETEDALCYGKMPVTPATVYVEAMLLHAADPHELSARHLTWVVYWSKRWSKLAGITGSPPVGKAISLTIDLVTGQPAGYQPVEGPNARWLDMGEIRRSLKKRIILLEKGTPPAELQLGVDCPQPACGQILKHVYQRWCRGGVNHKYEDIAANARCTIITGTETIYAHISGQTFHLSGYADDKLLRHERDKMIAFGDLVQNPPDAPSQQQQLPAEEWNVVEEWKVPNKSEVILHAMRPLSGNFGRVSRGQLVAIRPPSGTALLIGSLRWAMVKKNSGLYIGVAILPGKPEAIAVRVIESSGARKPYRPGFLLPAVAAAAIDASIIAPPGIFQVGQILELMGAPYPRVRAARLVDQGIDFDRIGFDPPA
jgi:hypothetical protein